MEPSGGHLGCPYCCTYEVDRLFVATVHLDACRCRACGASWDEEPESGTFRGRSTAQSALVRQEA
jgi:hypothetical protein